jgi:hypothetical protein
VGIGRILVELFLKGSRVILAFEAVVFGLFRIRNIFSLIRWPVVILKYIKVSYKYINIIKIAVNIFKKYIIIKESKKSKKN